MVNFYRIIDFHLSTVSFYEKTYKYFILGKVTTMIYHLYWLFHLSFAVAYSMYIVSTWISPYTPKIALLFLFLLPSLYASLSRAETAVNVGIVFGIFIFSLFSLC